MINLAGYFKQNLVSFLSNKRLVFRYYFNLKNKLKKQLKFNSNNIDLENISNKKIIVPLIETSHYQHLQILGLAKALELRGAEIKILICDGFLDACEIKSQRNEHVKNPCLNCKHHINKVLPIFNFQQITISDLISKSELIKIENKAQDLLDSETYEYLGYNFQNCLEDTLIRYYYGKISKDKDKIRSLKLLNIKTSIIGIIAGKKILDNFKPNIFLNNMNAYTTWSPLIDVFIKNNVQKVLINMASFNFKSIRFNIEDVFKDTKSFKDFKSKRKTTELSHSEENTLLKFMNDRTSGGADSFKKYNYFSKQSKNYIKEINFNTNKKNIFIFPNLLWDTGITENNTGLFDGILSWLFETIEILKDNKKINLYIKTHPAEEFSSVKSAKTVHDHVMEKYPNLPSNIKFILPKMKINSYELFKYIDLGLIYNGTIGLEMMLSQIPIVSVGKTVYNGLGFSYEPKNLNDYKNILLNDFMYDIDKIEEIKLFAYFYFIKTQIPWTLTKKVWGYNFKGYTFNSLDDIIPGKSKHLDLLCLSILFPETYSVYDDIDNLDLNQHLNK
jgi:hypothetical protein